MRETKKTKITQLDKMALPEVKHKQWRRHFPRQEQLTWMQCWNQLTNLRGFPGLLHLSQETDFNDN